MTLVLGGDIQKQMRASKERISTWKLQTKFVVGQRGYLGINFMVVVPHYG